LAPAKSSNANLLGGFKAAENCPRVDVGFVVWFHIKKVSWLKKTPAESLQLDAGVSV
jgi:hypothetical protein